MAPAAVRGPVRTALHPIDATQDIIMTCVCQTRKMRNSGHMRRVDGPALETAGHKKTPPEPGSKHGKAQHTRVGLGPRFGCLALGRAMRRPRPIKTRASNGQRIDNPEMNEIVNSNRCHGFINGVAATRRRCAGPTGLRETGGGFCTLRGIKSRRRSAADPRPWLRNGHGSRPSRIR